MCRNTVKELSAERGQRSSSSQAWPVSPSREIKTEASWHCLPINRAKFSRIWRMAELVALLMPTGHLCITHAQKPKPLPLLRWIEWHALSFSSFLKNKTKQNQKTSWKRSSTCRHQPLHLDPDPQEVTVGT